MANLDTIAKNTRQARLGKGRKKIAQCSIGEQCDGAPLGLARPNGGVLLDPLMISHRRGLAAFPANRLRMIGRLIRGESKDGLAAAANEADQLRRLAHDQTM